LENQWPRATIKEDRLYGMKTGHEELVRRTLDETMRHLAWMTLASRPRQLRD
jgi:hypothetical protein